MLHLDDLTREFEARFGQRLHGTEYRQLELYSKKKTLSFAEAEASDAVRLRGCLATETAFALLEGFLVSRQPEIENLPSWQKYLALPRKDAVDKLVAEVYRILRIHHHAWRQPEGRLETAEGLVDIRCVYEQCALSLIISPVGLELLESFVFRFLDAFRQPYGRAYLELLLTQYFSDIVAEVKGFSDLDRVLYQYQQRVPFNRHFRFDCDHPRFTLEADRIVIEIGKRHDDSLRYPIDFYLVLDDILYIVPSEVLKQGALALDQLPRWQARCDGDGATLPASFSLRFGRIKNVVGLPMT